MSDDVTQPKNIQRICPVISNAVRYLVRDKKGKETIMNAVAEAPCVGGRCMMWDIGKGKCGLLP